MILADSILICLYRLRLQCHWKLHKVSSTFFFLARKPSSTFYGPQKTKANFFTHHMCKLYQQWLNKNSSKSCCNRLPVQNFKERVHMYGSEVQTFDNGSEVKQQQQQVIQARSAGCIVAAECLQCFFQEKKKSACSEKGNASQARRGTSKLFGTFAHCAAVNLAGQAPLFTLHVSSCCWRIAATDWIKTLAFSPFLAAGFPEPFTAPLNFSVEHRLLFNVAVRFFF